MVASKNGDNYFNVKNASFCRMRNGFMTKTQCNGMYVEKNKLTVRTLNNRINQNTTTLEPDIMKNVETEKIMF